MPHLIQKNLLLTKWWECHGCKETIFNVDISFQEGSYVRFRCAKCKKEQRLTPDVMLGPNQSGGTHAHINWSVLPVLDEDDEPTAEHDVVKEVADVNNN